MTGVTAVAAGGLVQIRKDLADTEQMAGYGRQLNQAGYAVIADLVCGAEVEEIARFADGLVCGRAGTRRLIELPWCRDLALRLMHDHRSSDRKLRNGRRSRRGA